MISTQVYLYIFIVVFVFADFYIWEEEKKLCTCIEQAMIISKKNNDITNIKSACITLLVKTDLKYYNFFLLLFKTRIKPY